MQQVKEYQKSYDEDGKLIAEIMTGQDDEGNPEFDMYEQEVFCRQKEITRSEFYQSQQAGIEVQCVIAIAKGELEYFIMKAGKSPEKAVYDRKNYKVIRTYTTDEETELILGEI